MDPILHEICRVPRGAAVRDDVMRRWQHHIRTVVQPQLEELARLQAAHLAETPAPARKKVSA